MALDRELRKRRFRAALAMAGMTGAMFAEMNGFTPTHLSFVLSGKRTSARVTVMVDRFIKTVARRPEVAA